MRFSRTLQLATAVLLGSALVAPPAARAAAAGSSARIDTTRIRIDNFARVTDTYYRGSRPEGHDYVDLRALGVKTVIDLTGDDVQADEAAIVERAGMTYVHMPMTTHRPPTPAEVAAFLGVVSDPARQPVYVHCVGGRHRTGVMTAVYRMTHDGWTSDQAFTEMKQFKYGADFLHPEFKQFVYSYGPALRTAASRSVIATGLNVPASVPLTK